MTSKTPCHLKIWPCLCSVVASFSVSDYCLWWPSPIPYDCSTNSSSWNPNLVIFIKCKVWEGEVGKQGSLFYPSYICCVPILCKLQRGLGKKQIEDFPKPFFWSTNLRFIFQGIPTMMRMFSACSIKPCNSSVTVIRATFYTWNEVLCTVSAISHPFFVARRWCWC